MFDDQHANKEDLTASIEWVLTSFARHIAHGDANLHAMLRRYFDALTPEKLVP